MSTMDKWRASEQLYQSEGLGEDPAAPGIYKYQGLRVSASTVLQWEQFQKLCKKWHKKITKVSCHAGT